MVNPVAYFQRVRLRLILAGIPVVKGAKMKPMILLLALLLLAACATPREQCMSSATRDLRVLDRLIAESKANIERGYGYGTERFTNWQWGICGRYRNGTLAYCWEPYDSFRRVPVAVDLSEEQRKLDSMIRRRNELAREVQPRIAACDATYPAS